MTGNIKLAGFEIRKIDRKEMMIGLALIALSFLMPVLFTVQNFQDVYKRQIKEHMDVYLSQGIEKKEAMKLVAKDRGIGKRDVYQMLLEE